MKLIQTDTVLQSSEPAPKSIPQLATAPTSPIETVKLNVAESVSVPPTQIAPTQTLPSAQISPQPTPQVQNLAQFNANIDIEGLGNPYFDLILTVKNLSPSIKLIPLVVTFDYNPAIYHLSKPLQFTNHLRPNKFEILKTRVEMISEVYGVTDVIKCYFKHSSSDEIIKQVQIDMPPAEGLFF